MFYADLLSFHNEGINASAVPAIDGDKLGLTTQKQLPEISQKTLVETTSEGAGLGTAQKLFFIGVIVAVCVAFVKTRKDGRGAAGRGGKSMA